MKHILSICFLLSVSSLNYVVAITDAELEALENRIDQQEMEEKKQFEAESKRKAEEKRKAEAKAEKKRLVEIEKQRQQELRLFEEEKNKLEEDKRKLGEERQAELDRKRHAEEQKRIEEEAANAEVTVVFFRKSAFLGGGFQVSISNNGVSIGNLSDGSFFINTSPVGKQTFSTDKAFTSYGFSNTFDFSPGQIYYIQLLVGLEEGLKHVSKAEGREGIKKLTNTGNINPVDVLSD